jgi:hypothetical protein
MTTNVEAVELLTTKIDELPAEAVHEQLSPLIEYSGGSLVARIIAEADQSSIEPVFGLLGSVESAIGRISSPRIRSALGENAVEVIRRASSDTHFNQLKTGEEMITLLEHAERFAGFISDPKDRAWSWARIAGEAAEATSAHNTDDRIALTTLSDRLIEKAADAAGKITKPGKKAFTYNYVAKTAAKNLAEVSDRLTSIEGGEQLLADMAKRPAGFFHEASKAAQGLKDPKERVESQVSIAVAEARAAGIVNAANPELCRQLVDMVLTETGSLQFTVDEGRPGAKLSAVQKSSTLITLGTELAKVVDENHRPPGQNITQRQRLVRETARAFKAAGLYAQQATGLLGRKLFRLRGESLGSISSYATTAASRLLQYDFPSAQETLAASYDLAMAEDVDQGQDYRQNAQYVVGKIGEFAQERRNVGEAFGLFALAHDKESANLPEGERSHALEVNARQWLGYLSDSLPDETMAFDKINRLFVEFVVQIATTDSHVSWASHLSKLGRYVSDPALKETISDHIKNMRDREYEAKAPKSELERLAQLAVGQVV